VPEIGPLHALYLSQRFEPAPLDWLDHRAESGGGIVLHTGVHSFDLLRFLTGCEVTRVWCRTAQIITRETEDSFAMTCQLSNPRHSLPPSRARERWAAAPACSSWPAPEANC
jgi:predicted dehydrogenase